MDGQGPNRSTHLYLIRRNYLRFQEQLLCLFPRPLFWHLHTTLLPLAFLDSLLSFLLLLPQMFNNLTKPTVLAQEFQRRFGTDAFDRLQVVATEEDAQLNKLCERGEASGWR